MMKKESEHSHRAERSLMMSSVAYLSKRLQQILEERADELARETGCVQRQRKFSGASLLQTLVFGWQQHPDASLEQFASVAELHEVEVTDTAVQKRFTPKAAQFLHRVLEEACSLVVQAAQDVPVAWLRRFSAVILEDSSSIALPDELAEVWRGCGGNQEHTAAAVKLHVRLRTQARTALGATAHRWTNLGSAQPLHGGGDRAWQSGDQGFRLLPARSPRGAQESGSLLLDALA